MSLENDVSATIHFRSDLIVAAVAPPKTKLIVRFGNRIQYHDIKTCADVVE
jgi:hypothetical protein